ncbi:hypothetical protein GYMLUDRAFT_86243 [Collybiopsis luxurians FD-317 M1]|uniref:NACHT domain-containing protein n=1 Tax=Collybiopsis luxurians FD-317 M1 TaxID=944289 RepID=A0A0D0C830_9AGAR|nr:hypothetical protein GYMLUDRAFT_86243 [Collybiopsis luxurians FD-317 M1]
MGKKPISFPSKPKDKGLSKQSWNFLKEVLSVTKDLSSACPPLELAVSGVLVIMDQVDNINNVQEDLKEIATDIKQANDMLRHYFGNSLHVPIPIQERLEKYANTINQENGAIQKKISGHSWKRIFTAKQDAERIIEILQKLRKLKDQLQTESGLNTSIKVEQIFSKLLNKDLLSGKVIPGPKGDYLEGTRRNSLAKIHNWINDSDSRQSVFWLSGVAGCGKSTLMGVLHHDLLTEMGCAKLAAFVRFDRSTFSDPSLLVQALAQELADFSGMIGFEIAQSIGERPEIVKVTQVSTQLQTLIINPLIKCGSKIKQTVRSLVIIIDGLDECLDRSDQEAFQKMLRLFSDNLIGKGCPYIRLIIASRPTEEITAAFTGKPHIYPFYLDITTPETKSDIQYYLKKKLENIAAFQKLPKSELAPNGQLYILNELATRANGLFIWAAVVIKFINGYPEGRLQTFLATDIPNTSTKALTVLYQTALDSIAGEEDCDLKDHLRLVLGFTKFFHAQYKLGLEHDRLQNLLNYHTKHRLNQSFQIDLLSLKTKISSLLVGDKLIHKSLDDYLTDKDRCKKDWYIDPLEQKQNLAAACSICIIEYISRVTHNTGEGQLQGSMDFAYASENWAFYFRGLPCSVIEKEAGPLLQKYLLRWLCIAEHPWYNMFRGITLGCNIPYSLMELYRFPNSKITEI